MNLHRRLLATTVLCLTALSLSACTASPTAPGDSVEGNAVNVTGQVSQSYHLNMGWVNTKAGAVRCLLNGLGNGEIATSCDWRTLRANETAAGAPYFGGTEVPGANGSVFCLTNQQYAGGYQYDCDWVHVKSADEHG